MKTLQLTITMPDEDHNAGLDMIETLNKEEWEVKSFRLLDNDVHKWVLERKFEEKEDKETRLVDFIKTVAEWDIDVSNKVSQIKKHARENECKIYAKWLPEELFNVFFTHAEDFKKDLIMRFDDSDAGYFTFRDANF